MKNRAFGAYLVACFSYVVGASTYLVLKEREREAEKKAIYERNKRMLEESMKNFRAMPFYYDKIEVVDAPEMKRKWWKR